MKHISVTDTTIRQAGKAAGCYTIGVTTAFPAETLLRAGADCAIAEIGELPALLTRG